jgi:ABC-2 type transport system permease protein
LKDFALLRRDLRNLSGMITPIIMGIIYAVVLVRGGGGPMPGRIAGPDTFLQGFRELTVFGDVAISLFVGWVLSTRLATMGFSQEGRSWWILKTAPIAPRRLLAAKWIVAYLPVAVLGAVFLLIVSIVRGSAAADFVFGLLVLSLCYAAVTGVNLAFGVLGANFEWEDPRRMVRGAAGCLSTLASMSALGVSLLLFIGPTVVASWLGLPSAAGRLIGLGFGALACAAFAVAPPELVRTRVPRLGE